MEKTVEYQGYTIQSRPHYETHWQKWRVHIVISCEGHQSVQTREFSSRVLYATEQKADLHGIAFGMRLVEGKVEGQSVKEMKATDRRVTPRLRVQLHTLFSDSTKLEGIGTMLDVSMGGCRLESVATVEPGMSLELRIIHAPDIEWPLKIEAASVQWVRGQTFGLAFFRLKEDERQRLEQLIDHLTDSESRTG